MNFTIKNKLILLGAVAIMATSILGITAYRTNASIGAEIDELNKVKTVSELDTAVKTTRMHMTLTQDDIVAAMEDGVDEALYETIKKDENTVTSDMQKLIDQKPDYVKSELLTKRQEALTDFIKMIDSVTQAVKHKASLSSINTLLKEELKYRNILNQITESTSQSISEKRESIYKSVNDDISIANKTLLIVVLVTLAILVPFIVMIILGITRPLAGITSVVEKLAKGQYDTEVTGIDNKDEIGTLARGINAIRMTIADYTGQINALSKSQAVIEFKMDGSIVDANQNFMSMMGYNIEEMKGKHHSIFVDNAARNTVEYQQFWENMNRGQSFIGEFKRIHKNGKDVWVQASYNPILDLAGKPFKVVQYATETTAAVETRLENEEGMNESVIVLNAVSNGNLTQKMIKEYAGTFSQIKTAVNATIDQLKTMVIQIKESAESVNSASSEISSGSADLSQRTEQQASSLEETAASMEQITGTVRANSENSNNANKLSGSAREIAEKGGQVVEDAVNAMSNIEKSSQKISDIIGVIDEIAFQTNLLALNAAVEAARAGDAGKGFAVVASEVRTLAGRSASASKEIKQLISESATEVKSGAALVNQAGGTLKEIVSSVRQVADIVAEIAAATVEQSTGINEINSAISQMDEATQQNAALVEENTAAAQSLVEQANSLTEMMQFFSIDEESSRHQAPRAAVTHHTATSNVKALPKPAPKAAAKAAPMKKLAAGGGASHQAKQDGWEEF